MAWCLGGLWSPALGLEVENDVHRAESIPGETIRLTGKAELHLTGAGDPMAGSVVHLDSEDAWLFLPQVKPSMVASSLLGRIRVNGEAAVNGGQVRVAQYGVGTVVIPHRPDALPMEVFDGRFFSGRAKRLGTYTYHRGALLGSWNGAIRSFRLKRGYMATLAAQENGLGASRCYVAQDGDLEVSLLPAGLDGEVRSVCVYPWRWVSKKGVAGEIEQGLNVQWTYNWNLNRVSALDWEYVPIRQTRWWPGLNQDWKYRGATHLLGYNEPDRPDQANMTVAQAIAGWPDLLGTGLRLGAPAVSDGGLSWLYDFMDAADAAGLRVDYVPVHYYRAFSNPADASGTANQYYQFLKGIYDRVKRPLWVTEFNNGANWTSQPDPTYAQQAATVSAMIQMLDNAPFVERYAIYNWVEDVRRVKWDDGSLTSAGQVYRDKISPIGYVQELPDTGTSAAARYAFDGNCRDASGNGHEGSERGTPRWTEGKHGRALKLDGKDDFVQLPPRLGDSTDFSFAAWVKWDGGGNWQRIFDLGSDTANFMYLTPKSSSNQLRFNIRRNGVDQQVSASVLPTGVWTHVAVTLSGSTGKIFVNGALAASSATMTFNPVDLGTTFNWIGRGQFPSDPTFAGCLDDARFHGSALSDAEVAALAAGGAPDPGSGVATAPAATRRQPYRGSLAEVTGWSGLSYRKLGGPEWLAVAPDGRLSGVPGLSDRGEQRFIVQAMNSTGGMTMLELRITVKAAGPVVARYALDGSALAAAGEAGGVSSGSPGWVVGQVGQVGLAIDLDGVDDFVTLPAGVASHEEITVAAWVRWDGGGDWQRVFDFGNGPDEHLFLTPRSSQGRMRFSIENGNVAQFIESSSALPTGTWVHVAATLGGGTGKIYLNGAMAASGSMSFRPADFDPVSNFLGKSQFADPLFDGRIDELLIFDRVLTAEEIAGLRSGRAPVFARNPIIRPEAAVGVPYAHSLVAAVQDADAGDSIVYSKVSGPEWLQIEPDGRMAGVPSLADSGVNRFRIRAMDSHLLAADAMLEIVVPTPAELRYHYDFDGDCRDRAGAMHGTAQGGAGYAAGVFDGAVELDGTDDFVSLPGGMLAGMRDCTFSARVRWDGGGAWQRIFDFGNGTSQFLCLTPKAGNGAGGLRFTLKNGGDEQQLNHSAPLPTGEWAHVAVTLSGNTGRLYLDGAMVDSKTITIDPADFAPSISYLGKSLFAADPAFDGRMDDLKIFDRALSAEEVASLAVSLPAVEVPDQGYAEWVHGVPFPEGKAGREDDPDGDGVVNLLEYLFRSDPLSAGATGLPKGMVKEVSGLEPGKRWLCLEARVRKSRPGIRLIPEGAATIEGLGDEEASSRVEQSGEPRIEGEDEVFTWYYRVPVEEAADGRGFLRLRVIEE